MSEEKDLDLGALVDEFDGIQQRVDVIVRDHKDDPAALATALAFFIQNDLLVQIKDVAVATLIGLQELEDLADPVKITRADAEQQVELLLAYRAQNAGNPQLLQKIDEQLEALEYEPGGEEDEEG